VLISRETVSSTKRERRSNIMLGQNFPRLQGSDIHDSLSSGNTWRSNNGVWTKNGMVYKRRMLLKRVCETWSNLLDHELGRFVSPRLSCLGVPVRNAGTVTYTHVCIRRGTRYIGYNNTRIHFWDWARHILKSKK
jgi:hypothetical protein